MTASHFQSATIPQDRLLPGIHGLRGIAAMEVVLYHLVHLVKIKPPAGFTFITSDFGYGVHLFFILSAFSLMHSTEHTLSRPTWAWEYFIKRLFRIAPLFYFLLAIMVWKPSLLVRPMEEIIQTLLLNLTFTFGFTPWAGIVWAGWSVGVEMMFYVIFPVLLLTLRSTSATFWLLLASLVVSYASRSILYVHFANSTLHNTYNWAYFSFTPNLCFFAMGIYAYRLSRVIGLNSILIRRVIPAGTLALLGVLMFTTLAGPLHGTARIDLMLWGTAFAALTLWQGTLPSAWCSNRFFTYVGERSYSIYLLHPVVIGALFKQPLYNLYNALSPQIGSYAYFICLLVVMVPLLLLSELTYRFIEVPGIQYGQRLNRKIRNNLGKSSSVYSAL